MFWNILANIVCITTKYDSINFTFSTRNYLNLIQIIYIILDNDKFDFLKGPKMGMFNGYCWRRKNPRDIIMLWGNIPLKAFRFCESRKIASFNNTDPLNPEYQYNSLGYIIDSHSWFRIYEVRVVTTSLYKRCQVNYNLRFLKLFFIAAWSYSH